MKIQGNNDIQKIMAIYKKMQPERTVAKKPNTQEQIEISDTSRALYEKMQSIKDTDAISDKARDIKAAYKAGRYEVSPDKLANSLLKMMEEERATNNIDE